MEDNMNRRPYEPIKGSPRRRTPMSPPVESPRKTKPEMPRKKRVQVTPNDWEALEEVAEHLGLPCSKVYNVAFRAYLNSLSWDH